MLMKLIRLLTKDTFQQLMRRGIDNLFALIGLILGLLVASFSALYYGSLVIIGLCTAATCGIYLIIGKKESKEVVKQPSRILKLLSILFFIMVFLSLGLLPDSQTGALSVLFYIFIAIAYSVIATEIVILKSNIRLRPSIYIIFQIFFVSLILRIAIYSQFPSILGTDPWVNYAMVSEVLQTGFIPQYFTYAKVPLFPIGLLCNQIITGLDFKASLFLFGGIIELGTIIFLFVVGRELANLKTALLACLLFSFYPSFIGFGSHSIIAMSMGLTLFCLLLLLLVTSSSKHLMRTKALIIICLSALVMTHVIASIIGLLLITSFFIAGLIKDRKADTSLIQPITSYLYLLSIILLVSYWMWVSGFIGYIIDSIVYALQIAQGDAISPVMSTDHNSNYEFVINTIINSVTWSLSILSALVLINKHQRMGKWGIIIFSVLGFFIIEVSSTFRFDAILPERWEPFIYLGMVLLFAFSLVYLSSKTVIVGKVAVVCIVATLCTSMVFSAAANTDSPLIDSTFRYGFQTSEMLGSNFASEKITGDFSTDYQLAYTYYWYGSGEDVDVINSSYFNGNIDHLCGTILIRNYCIDNYFLVNRGIFNKTVGYTELEIINGGDFDNNILQNSSVLYSTPTLKIYIG